MQVIRKDADLPAIRSQAVRNLVDLRAREAEEHVDRFGELVFFVVVESGDDLARVLIHLGFSLLRNRFDDVPYGSPDFTPSWDVLEEHEACFELLYVLADDGSGVGVFVIKEEGVDPQLLSMCREYVGQEATHDR